MLWTGFDSNKWWNSANCLPNTRIYFKNIVSDSGNGTDKVEDCMVIYIFLFIFHSLRTVQFFPTNKNHRCIMILLPSRWMCYAYFSWTVPKLCHVPSQDLHFFPFLPFTFQSVSHAWWVPLTCRCLWTKRCKVVHVMWCTHVQMIAIVNHTSTWTWFCGSFMPNMASMSNLL